MPYKLLFFFLTLLCWQAMSTMAGTKHCDKCPPVFSLADMVFSKTDSVITTEADGSHNLVKQTAIYGTISCNSQNVKVLGLYPQFTKPITIESGITDAQANAAMHQPDSLLFKTVKKKYVGVLWLKKIVVTQGVCCSRNQSTGELTIYKKTIVASGINFFHPTTSYRRSLNRLVVGIDKSNFYCLIVIILFGLFSVIAYSKKIKIGKGMLVTTGIYYASFFTLALWREIMAFFTAPIDSLAVRLFGLALIPFLFLSFRALSSPRGFFKEQFIFLCYLILLVAAVKIGLHTENITIFIVYLCIAAAPFLFTILGEALSNLFKKKRPKKASPTPAQP